MTDNNRCRVGLYGRLGALAMFALVAAPGCALDTGMTRYDKPMPGATGITPENVKEFVSDLEPGDVVFVFDASGRIQAYDGKTLLPLPTVPEEKAVIRPGRDGSRLKSGVDIRFIEGSCQMWPSSFASGFFYAPIELPDEFCE